MLKIQLQGFAAVVLLASIISCGTHGSDSVAEIHETSTSGLPKGGGGQNGDPDYCTDTNQCLAGEGDCDRNSHCITGTICPSDNGPRFGMPRDYEVCVPSSCTNNIQDANEAGVDCGGTSACGTCETSCGLAGLGGSAFCSSVCRCQTGQGDCDNNSHCAPGLVCVNDLGARYNQDPLNDVCVPAHCNDHLTNFDEAGVDCGGSCLNDCPALCGNGTLEAGEACDDGNSASGDGCSATCTAEECFEAPALAVLSAGDSACPAGGARLTQCSVVVNVCSGVAGAAGTNGADGAAILYQAVVAASGGTHTTIEAALASGAKRILVKNGEYVLSGELELGSDVWIEGEDRAQTVIRGPYAIRAGSNVTMKKMTLRNSAFLGGITATGSDNVFENIDLESTERLGVQSGERTVVRDSRIVATLFPLILSAHARVERNYLEAENIETTIGDGSWVVDNEILATGSFGIALNIGEDASVRGNRITISAAGSQIWGMTAETGTELIGNRISGGLIGIDFDADVGGGVLQANIVDGSETGYSLSAATNPGYGNLLVQSNLAFFTTGTGFLLRGSKLSVVGNNVYGAGSDCFAQSTPGSLRRSVISSNSAESCGARGFYFPSILGVTLQGNKALGCSGAGFVLGGSDNIVNANHAEQNGVGFELLGTLSNNVLTSNIATLNLLGNWSGAQSGGVTSDNL